MFVVKVNNEEVATAAHRPLADAIVDIVCGEAERPTIIELFDNGNRVLCFGADGEEQ